ncbi:MAG: hypothetical protein V3T58_06870 [Candidatus Hydrothermarchaeales archaeon]
MVYFDEAGMLIGQTIGHHGMMELYVHIYAATFLFLASIAAIVIIYTMLKDTKFSWQAMLWAIFYIGLIGLGEAGEHFSAEPFIHDFFHYMHMIAAPLALIFLYLGVKEFSSEQIGDDSDAISTEIGMIALAATSTLIIIMASMAESPWDVRVEGPFLYLTSIPTVILVAILLRKTREIVDPFLSVHVPLVSILVSLLTIDIMIGRYVDIERLAAAYIMTHALQDIFHVVLATVLLPFAVSLSRTYKLKMAELASLPRDESKPKPKSRPKIGVDY